jgi:methionine synthase II (cobalamin-independent)
MEKTPTAMIGSLPQKNPDEALKALSGHPLGIPTWPQLPKRSFKESMTVQYSEGFPGILIDEKEKRISIDRNDKLLDEMAVFYDNVLSENHDAFAISADYAGGLHAFIDERSNIGTKAPLIKGQVVGPFTFGFSLSDNDCKAVWFDEQYRDVVIKGIAMKAVWQAKKLSAFAEKVVIFMDEPIFSALGTPTYMGIENDHVVSCINEIAEQLHAVNASVGVHCCGNMEWSLLTSTALDVLAFDAYGYGDKVALYPEAVSGFLERGGTLAWGIVPTALSEDINKETAESLIARIRLLEEMFFKKGVSPKLLREQRILTPSCGMGNLSEKDAQRVLTLLGALSEAKL